MPLHCGVKLTRMLRLTRRRDDIQNAPRPPVVRSRRRASPARRRKVTQFARQDVISAREFAGARACLRTAHEAPAIYRAEDRVECISMFIIMAITRSRNNLAATDGQTDGRTRANRVGSQRVKTTRLISNNQRRRNTRRLRPDILVDPTTHGLAGKP